MFGQIKRKSLLRKSVAWLLTLVITLSSIPYPALGEITGIEATALRVSDTFVSLYPNGLVEFATVNFETVEGAGDLDVFIVRRGGTEGKVSVGLKAVEITAKYGEDFVLLKDGILGPKEIKKELESPTFLESSLQDSADLPLTVEPSRENENDINEDDINEDDINEDDINEDDINENDINEDDINEDDINTDTAEIIEAHLETEEVVEDPVYSEDSKDPAYPEIPGEHQSGTEYAAGHTNEYYTSSLHQAKDTILGKQTAHSSVAGTDVFSFFADADASAPRVDEAINTVLPGAHYYLTFEEGEAYKHVKVRIIDDEIYEDDEIFNLVLFDIEGAVLGDAITASVIIKDNDRPDEQASLYFAENSLAVIDGHTTARLKLVRAGNEQTYLTFDVATMGHTAISGENYTTLIAEGVMLPGQTYKYIDIPIHYADIKEELSFSVSIGADGFKTTAATVYILPATMPPQPVNPAYSSAVTPFTIQTNTVVQPFVTIKGSAYNNTNNSGSSTTRSDPTASVVLNSGLNRSGQLSYNNLDLRGIEKIGVDFSVSDCQSDYTDRHRTSLSLNGLEKEVWRHNVDRTEAIRDDIPRTNGVSLTMQTQSWYWNYAVMTVHNIKLYKQQIYITTAAADTFQVPIYGDQKEIVGYLTDDRGDRVSVLPGSLSITNTNTGRPNHFFRDDTLALASNLTSDGRKYGASLSGYALYNPESGTWTPFSGTSLTLTPELISTYVYGDGKTYRSNLQIKPVFSREAAHPEIQIDGSHLHVRGNVSIGGTILQGGATYDGREGNQVLWRVGDYLQVNLTPAAGYSGNGLKDRSGNLLTPASGGTLNVQLKAADNWLVPQFARNDCGVTLIPGTGHTNLYVFHDQRDHASAWELEELYKDTDGLTNTEVDAEGTVVRVTNALNNKIKENYDRIRGEEAFQSRTLSNLAIGDVVTLYAETKDESYLPFWIYRDLKTQGLAGDALRYTKHYGESFTFEIRSNDTIIEYGAVSKAGEDYLLQGKIVRLNNTLKSSRTYDRVNINIPDSFIPVPNVALGVMSFDSTKHTYTDIDGSVYSISTTTDINGDFKMYIPNVSQDELFSIKYVNGGQSKARSLPANKDRFWYIDTPYRDEDYTVNSIWCYTITGADGEQNGTITIPADPTLANRDFRVETTTSSSNHRISRVGLNSYNAGGVLIKTVDMARSGGSDGSGPSVWNARLNIAETLTAGGRITVEVYDASGNSRGEVETGYLINEDPPDFAVEVGGMGTQFANMGPGNFPVTGNQVPTVPNTSFYQKPDDFMEIAVLSGETLKAAILDNLETFDNESNWDKLVFLTNYVSETFAVNVSKSTSESPSSESRFPILFDFGLYMKLGSATDGDGKTSYVLHYAFVSVGLKAAAAMDCFTILYGIPVYLSLSATAYGRGVVGFIGDSDDFESHSIHNNDFIFLLAKYGKDAISNNRLADTDPVNQALLAAIYHQAGLQRQKMPSENQTFNDYKSDNPIEQYLLLSLWSESKNHVLDGLNNLITDNIPFYLENEALFEAKGHQFSDDLLSRIALYKGAVQFQRIEPADPNGTSTTFEPSIIITNKPDLTDRWLQRFNLLLLTESLRGYLTRPKFTINVGDEKGVAGLSLDEFLGMETVGIITLQPRFMIGAGVGKRGKLSIGASGHINFILNYQPWSNGRGTVTFAFNADMDVLVIPLTFRLVGYTYEMFNTPGYIMNAFDYEDLGGSGIFNSSDIQLMHQGMRESSEAFVRTNTRRVSGGNGLIPLGAGEFSPMSSYNEEFLKNIYGEYYMETTKHPQPRLFTLEGGKKIMFYLNDNLSREEYDRNSIYYTIYNGSTWNRPQELEGDGTLDGDLNALKLPDGRIVVAWTNANKVFGGQLPPMAEYLSAQDISVCIFSPQGIPGEIVKLAGSSDYAYSIPAITYDQQSGTILLAYKMTDYHTEGITFDYDDLEGTYSNFFANSYSTLAYHLYDDHDGNWQLGYDGNNREDLPYLAYAQQTGNSLNGGKFIDLTTPGVENPHIDEMAVGTYKGKAFLVYTLDLDNNQATDNDKELFVLLYDYQEQSFQGPIRLTTNLVTEGNPWVVVSDYINSIYYASGGGIKEINLDTILDYLDYYNGQNTGSYQDYLASTHPDGIIAEKNILGYENQDAAQSFTVTVADNNQVYLLWNQFEVFADEPAANGDPKTARNLYMQVYDPKFQAVEHHDPEAGLTISYIGNWGLPGRITEERGVYINEVSMVVTPDNIYTLAFREYEFETVTGGEAAYQKEADTSTLYVAEFELISTISIETESLSIYPLYPRSNELVSLDYHAKNYGTIPSESVQFNYYLVTDGDLDGLDETTNYWWQKTDQLTPEERQFFHFFDPGTSFTTLPGKAIDGHLKTGGLVGDTVNFFMPPFTHEVNLFVLAWETAGDVTGTPSIIKVPLPINPLIELLKLDSDYSEEADAISIGGTIINTGNLSAENLEVTIMGQGSYDLSSIILDSTNDLAEFSSQVNQPVGSFTLPLLAPDERYEFGFLLRGAADNDLETQATIARRSRLANLFTSDGSAEFNIYAETDQLIDASPDQIQIQATIGRRRTIVGATTATIPTSPNPTLANISVQPPTSAGQQPETQQFGIMGSTASSIVNGTGPHETLIGVVTSPTNLETETAESGDELTLQVGERKSLNIKLEPYGTSKLYRLHYRSSDPSVVSIDPSSGTLQGQAVGTAEIYIDARRNDQGSILIGLDNSLTLVDGTTIEITEDGAIANPADLASGEQEVVYTKALTVTVTEATAPHPDDCFIATAAFGSKLDPAVTLLRQFRDTKLLTNKPGRSFVNHYYRLSPPIAAKIADNNLISYLVRIILIPIIGAAYLLMHPLPLIIPVCLGTAALLKSRKRGRNCINAP